MSFSAPSSASGKLAPRPMIEHVAGLGDFLRPAPRSWLPASGIRRCGAALPAARRKAASRRPRSSLPRASPAAMAKRGQRRQLAGEGLGRGDADLRTGIGGQHDIGFARDGAFRHIDHRDGGLALGLGIAQAPPACRRSRPTATRTAPRRPWDRPDRDSAAPTPHRIPPPGRASFSNQYLPTMPA